MGAAPSSLKEILIRLGDDIWQKTRVKEKEVEYLSMITGCVKYDDEMSRMLDEYYYEDKEPDRMPMLYEKIVESNGEIRLSIDSGSRKEMFGLGSIEALSDISQHQQLPFTPSPNYEEPRKEKKHWWSRR